MLPQNWRYMTLMFILHVPSGNYILILLFCLIWYLKNSKIKVLFQTVYPTVFILNMKFFVILSKQTKFLIWKEWFNVYYDNIIIIYITFFYSNNYYYYKKMCIVLIWINNVHLLTVLRRWELLFLWPFWFIENDNFKYS